MNGFKVLKAQIISELDNLKKLLDEAADIVNTTAHFYLPPTEANTLFLCER